MHIVIWTQYRENYGFENGQDYWKNKGGSTYVVSDISVAEAQSLSFFNKLLSLIEYSNSASSEIMTEWELRDGEYVLNEEETWEKPIFIRREGDEFIAEETSNNDGQFRDEIASKRATWIMTPEGGRRNYQPEYTLRDGRVVDEAGLIQFLKMAS